MPESIIEQLRAQSKDAIDFFLKLGELMERGEVEVEVVVRRKQSEGETEVVSCQ